MRPAVFLLLILALLASRAEAAEAALVVVTADRTPMAYVENGHLTGLLVELAQEGFRRVGREIEIKLLPWPRCMAELKDGQADAALTIFKTPEREAQFAFSNEAVLQQTESLFMKKGRAFDYDGDLGFFSGKRIGVIYQTSYGPRFDKALTESQFLEVETERNMADLVKMLAHDRIDLLPGDRGRILGAAATTGLADQIVELSPAVENVSGYMAFTKARDLHLTSQAFDKALKSMKRDGTYAAILGRYPNF